MADMAQHENGKPQSKISPLNLGLSDPLSRPFASLLPIGPSTGFAQPTLTSQPTNQVANQGYSAAFQVRATGTPPLSYQWNFNAVALGGATASRLTITNASPANRGDYFVVVADATGSVRSRVAHLEVILPATLAPRIGPNLRLGDDPSQLPANQRAQAEPHIVRSFTDPNLIVAIFQEGRFTDAGALSYQFGDYQAIVPALDFDTPAIAAWIDARSGDPDPFVVSIQRPTDSTSENWSRLRFSDPSVDLSPGADPDGDGLPNFVEYALGLEPNHPDPNPLTTALLHNPGEGDLLEIKFQSPAVVVEPKFSWESSTNLTNWQLARPVGQAIEGVGFTRTHSAQFPVEPRTTRFFRLKVTNRSM